MMRIIIASAAIACVSAVSPAFAQQRCPLGTEGRTQSGQCVSPRLSALAGDMRQRGIIFSQPKFSYSTSLAPADYDQTTRNEHVAGTPEQHNTFSAHHNP